MGEGSGGAGRPGLSAGRFREIALEAFLIVFAVLAALAAQEWWDDLERHKRAQEALVAVQGELERNMREIEDNAAENDSSAALIERALTEGNIAGSDLGFSLSLLRSDVWEASQVTGATQALDLEWIARVSQVYGVQEIFITQQDRMVQAFAEYITLAPTGGPRATEALRLLQTQLLFTFQFRCNLIAGYGFLIEELESGELDEVPLTERMEGVC